MGEILLNCPHCYAKLRVPASLGGHTKRCPKCREPVTVPGTDSEPPSEDPDHDSGPVLDRGSRWRLVVRWSLLIGGAVVAVSAWPQPPSTWWLAGHCATLAATVALGLTIAKRFNLPLRALIISSVIVGLGLSYLTDKHATYREFHDLDDGTRLTLTKDRRRRMVYGRSLQVADGVSTGISGGYSQSGQAHGAWEQFTYGPNGSTTERQWYWYGEVISEGEWHLRNK